VVGGDGGMRLERKDGLDPPLAVIAAGPARSGNVYQGTDADGIMRQHAPLVRHGDRLYPSLALAAYLVAHPGVAPSLRDGRLVLTDAAGGKAPVVIPLDEHGRFSLRFHRAGAYPRISAYEVLRSQAQLDEGQAPAIAFERLRGKYVIVAATGQALRDVRITPLGTPVAGSEIQATAIDNLEAARVIKRASRGGDAAAALALCTLVALGVTGGVDGDPQDHDRAGRDHRDHRRLAARLLVAGALAVHPRRRCGSASPSRPPARWRRCSRSSW
jgi:adenylate cyclase